MVDKAVHPLGDKAGGAGVLRDDARLAEDQPLGDKGGHGVVPGAADGAGALLHQGLDLVPGQPADIKDVLGIIGGQLLHLGQQALVRPLAHKEEGRPGADLAGQEPDGVHQDVLPLAGLEGPHADKEGQAAGVAGVVGLKGVLGVVGQAVDQLPDLEAGAVGVHGGGGVAAHGADPDVGPQLPGDQVGQVPVPHKGVVEPPQHRHRAAAQGADGLDLHDSVGDDQVGGGGQPPQGGGADAVGVGDGGGPGLHKKGEGTPVPRAQDGHLIAHPAQHRHRADQHDGGAGHVQHMAEQQGPFAPGGEQILGAGRAAVAQQGLGDVHRLPGQPEGQLQQGGGAVGVFGPGAAALQQRPGKDGAPASLGAAGSPVDHRVPLEAKHRVAEGKVRPALQSGCKIGEGGAEALGVLGGHHHPVHPLGQAVQGLGQLEFAVELQLQAGGQAGTAPRRIDRQPGALGVLVGLGGQLELLELTVSGIHGVPRLICSAQTARGWGRSASSRRWTAPPRS